MESAQTRLESFLEDKVERHKLAALRAVEQIALDEELKRRKELQQTEFARRRNAATEREVCADHVWIMYQLGLGRSVWLPRSFAIV
eukprot:SAG11_NODE_8867_length_968_cov_1.284235_2_plen_86_part_00